MKVEQFKKLSERDQFFAALILDLLKAVREVRTEMNDLRREIWEVDK